MSQQENINVHDFLDFVRDREEDLYEHLCDLLDLYRNYIREVL